MHTLAPRLVLALLLQCAAAKGTGDWDEITPIPTLLVWVSCRDYLISSSTN